MRVARKIVGLDLLGILGMRSVVEQDGAENGFFGVDVRGKAGIESEIGEGGHPLSLGRRVSVTIRGKIGNLENASRGSRGSLPNLNLIMAINYGYNLP